MTSSSCEVKLIRSGKRACKVKDFGDGGKIVKTS